MYEMYVLMRIANSGSVCMNAESTGLLVIPVVGSLHRCEMDRKREMVREGALGSAFRSADSGLV